MLTAACGQLEWAPNPAPGRNGAHVQAYVVVPQKKAIGGWKALLRGLLPAFPEDIDDLNLAEKSWVRFCTDEERSLQRVEEYCNDPQKDSADDGTDMFKFGVFPTGKKGNQGGAVIESLRPRLLAGESFTSFLNDGSIPLEELSRHRGLFLECEKRCMPERGYDFDPIWFHLHSEDSGVGKGHWVQNGGLEAATGGKYKFPDDVYKFCANTGGNANWVTHKAAQCEVWWLDEWNGESHCRQDGFKQLVDRGPFVFQGKGFTVPCMAKVIITTSNFSLEECWPTVKKDNPEVWERNMIAIRRRFREFGQTPNFRLFLREKRLERRLTEQGGLRVHLSDPSQGTQRRIVPERITNMLLDRPDWQGEREELGDSDASV